ncbi:MAG: helix-turn-helix transcriptional regulator [Lachnospiraceae bacterium]|nr:helix-turn-helix transcriptional regulator [Lachnospiraceae bacterium]MBP3611085.1 helix-turn-helix transcriptional regulator [Lachnospiraceae bacterium]
MITYEPLWNTLREKGITKYQLIYHWGISSNTFRRMSHNEAISSTTLNELCLILECDVQDVLNFAATEEELRQTETKRTELKEKFPQKRKPPASH